MAKRIPLLLLATGLALAAFSALGYRAWLDEARERLEGSSEVIQTAAGPIEVARSGERGPSVLLVHGTPGGYDQTLPLAPRFASHGLPVLAVSRPGYLRTPLRVGATPAAQADAYAALLDTLGLERVAIVGISGGGPSSIEFAIRHPERCWALVDLMGVSRGASEEELEAARDMRDNPIGRLLGSNAGGYLLGRVVRAFPDGFLDLAVPDPANAARIRADPAEHAALVGMVEGSLTLAAERAAGNRNDMSQFQTMGVPDFAAVRAPTLVIHGRADVNVPLDMAELVAGGVAGAELVTIPGGDHAVMFSHPDRVYGAVFTFLERHAPR